MAVPRPIPAPLKPWMELPMTAERDILTGKALPAGGGSHRFLRCGLGLISAAALPPVHAIPVLLVSDARAAVADRRYAGVLAGGTGRVLVRVWAPPSVGLYWITEAILLESARYWWLVPLAVPASFGDDGFVHCGGGRRAARLIRAWMAAGVLGFAAVLWLLADLAPAVSSAPASLGIRGAAYGRLPGAWPGDVMLQPAAWVGTPGLTFADGGDRGAAAAGAARAGLGMAAVLDGRLGRRPESWLGWGGRRKRSPGIAVVLVQGNVAQGQKWDRATAEEVFERHEAAECRRGCARPAARPSVVIWPETASVVSAPNRRGDARQAIAAADGPALGRHRWQPPVQ